MARSVPTLCCLVCAGEGEQGMIDWGAIVANETAIAAGKTGLAALATSLSMVPGTCHAPYAQPNRYTHQTGGSVGFRWVPVSFTARELTNRACKIAHCTKQRAFEHVAERRKPDGPPPLRCRTDHHPCGAGRLLEAVAWASQRPSKSADVPTC